MHLPVYLLPGAGLLIGVLISLMGGGGGIFYVGIMTGLFAIPMDKAVSVSLATIIPTTLAATFGHLKAGNVRVRIGVVLIIGGIIGVIAGSYLVTLIPRNILRMIFGVFMLVMGGQMILSRNRSKKRSSRNNDPGYMGNETDSLTMDKSTIVKGLAFGIPGGLMSGMLGASGTPPILAGLYSLGLSSLEVVGTSVMILFFIALAGVITHSSLGTLSWPLVLLLASGTITGAILGPKIGKLINEEVLEKFYGPFFTIFIIMTAVSMFFK